jgi:cyclase
VLLPRIIPCLLIKNKGLVKTVKFTSPKYVGDPINAVKIFNEKEVDELMVLDIDASVQAREPDYELIRNLAAECRMPLCYGGGVKTVAQAERIVSLGVEKVAISSAAVEDVGIVGAIAAIVGSQSAVVVLDARRNAARGTHEIWTHNGLRNTGKSLHRCALEAEQAGAGEIVLNAIDNDGVMKGYDLDMAREIHDLVKVPITVLGGAGSLEHIGALIRMFGTIGAAAGSLFVFKGAYRAVLINYPRRPQKDELVMQSYAVHAGLQNSL